MTELVDLVQLEIEEGTPTKAIQHVLELFLRAIARGAQGLS